MAFQSLAAAQVSAEVPVNENNTALGQAFCFSKNAVTTTGLTQGYNGGNYNVTTVADGTVALTASATNYLVVHRTTLVVSSSTATTNWNDSTTYGRMARGVTSASVITSYTDERYSPGGIFATAGSASPVTSVAGRTGAVVVVAADLADFSETVDDRVAVLVVGSGGVRKTYDDPGNTLTLDAEHFVNAQTGTTYTYLTGDRAKLVTHSNAAAIAGALPVAGGTTFPAGWFADIQNRGVGTLTITPTTSTLDGAASLALTTNQGVRLVSDGTNYFTQRGVGGAGGGGAMATDVIWDVAGDLVQGTGANTAARLAIGTALQVLRVNAGATAVEWAASASGSTVGRHAVYVAAGSMHPSVTGGCAVLSAIATSANLPDIRSLDFDTNIVEYAQFSMTMPKSWNEGTVTWRPVWSHAATTVNFGVVFDLQGYAASDTDAIATAYGTAVSSFKTGGTTNALYVGPESTAITIAGTPAAEDTVFFRVARQPSSASDTLAIDARLHGLVLYITTDADTDS